MTTNADDLKYQPKTIKFNSLVCLCDSICLLAHIDRTIGEKKNWNKSKNEQFQWITQIQVNDWISIETSLIAGGIKNQLNIKHNEPWKKKRRNRIFSVNEWVNEWMNIQT